MNNDEATKEKKKRELWISLGFVLEVSLFMLAGFFLANKSLIGFLFLLIVSLFVAFAVGERIEKNAIINYKNNLN